jgi:hypothetical protein
VGEAGALPCGACSGACGFLTCEAVLRTKAVFRTIGQARPTGAEDRPRGQRQVWAVRVPPWGLAVGEAGALPCGACSEVRGFLTCEAVLRPKAVFRTSGQAHPTGIEDRPRGRREVSAVRRPLIPDRGGGWGLSLRRLLWGSWALDKRSSPPPEGCLPHGRPGSSREQGRPAARGKGGLGRKGLPFGIGMGGCGLFL